MSRIQLVLDPHQMGGSERQEALVVDGETAYWESRRRIREALAGSGALLVWVDSERYVERYVDLAGCEEVATEERNPRGELARKLGMAVPPELTDQMVLELGLESMAGAVTPLRGESALQWVERVLVGGSEGQCVRSGDLGTALDAIVRLCDGDVELKPLVGALLAEEATASPWPDVLEWMAEAPAMRARCLASAVATIGYGDRSLQWMTGLEFGVADCQAAQRMAARWPAEAQLPRSALAAALREQLGGALADGLRHTGPAAVAAARGRIVEEQRAVYDYLRGRAAEARTPLTSAEADQLLGWLDGCPRGPLRVESEFACELLREGALPEPLAPRSDWAEAAYWLEEHYLPACAALAVTSRLENTEACVASYERWLMENYRGLARETQALSHSFGAGLAARARGGFLVVIVLDGVPYLASRWLLNAIGSADLGLSVEASRCYVSLLPSTTSVNKPCVLLGRLPDQCRELSDSALSEALRLDPSALRFLRTRSASEIEAITPEAGGVLVVDFLAVDQDVLHAPMASLDRWLETIRRLSSLIEPIGGLARAARERAIEMTVGCISDHGWTELPADARVMELPADVLESVHHARVAKGQAPRGSGLALTREGWYLPDDYTVASGYSYYSRRPHGAVHGGATPQETAVLGFWLTTRPGVVDTVPALSIELDGEVRRNHPSNVAVLVIRNHSSTDLHVQEVRFRRLRAESGEVPVRLGGGGSVRIRCTLDATGAGETLLLAGEVVATNAYGTHRVVASVALSTSGALRTQEAFDNMFDV